MIFLEIVPSQKKKKGPHGKYMLDTHKAFNKTCTFKYLHMSKKCLVLYIIHNVQFKCYKIHIITLKKYIKNNN